LSSGDFSVQEIAKCLGLFDVKNGHRLVDPAGVDCEGDVAARKQGIAIAKQISVDAPRSMARSVAVRDEAGRAVAIIPIGTST
jgi:hypothetical protein